MPQIRDYPRMLYRLKPDGEVEFCVVPDADGENALKPSGWVRENTGKSSVPESKTDSADLLSKRSRKLPGAKVH